MEQLVLQDKWELFLRTDILTINKLWIWMSTQRKLGVQQEWTLQSTLTLWWRTDFLCTNGHAIRGWNLHPFHFCSGKTPWSFLEQTKVKSVPFNFVKWKKVAVNRKKKTFGAHGCDLFKEKKGMKLSLPSRILSLPLLTLLKDLTKKRPWNCLNFTASATSFRILPLWSFVVQ